MSVESEDVVYLQRLCGGDGLSGPGDDAALVRTGRRILVTIDPVIEGRHFEPGTSPARVGRKLVHRSFSDLAAMGSWPTAVVASFCFGTGWERATRRRLYRAVHAATRRVGADWVGGDVAATSGPSVFTLCALGEPCGPRPVPRGGLRPGDLLFVTGRLGGSRRSGHHLDFVPRLEWGRRLATEHRPSAMIDVSDGLALDLARMLIASGGLGATLAADRIPLRPRCPVRSALTEGEDHELLFGLRPRAASRLRDDPELPAQARRSIGRVDEEPGLRLALPEGRVEPLEPEGFQHVLP